MLKTLQNNLARKILVLVAIPLAFQIIFVGVFAVLLHQTDEERLKEMHSREVTAQVNVIFNQLISAIISGMLCYGLDQRDNKVRLLGERQAAKKAEMELQQLLKGNPEEERKAVEMRMLHDQIDACLFNAKRDTEAEDQLSATKEFLTIENHLNKFLNLFKQTTQTQISEQQEQKRKQVAYRQALEAMLIVGVVTNFLVTIALTAALNRSITKRLRLIIDNTNRLAAGRDLNAPVGGQDEIARLDDVFRDMSGALAEARRKERAILEHAAELICTLDQDGRFTEANTAALAVLDRAKADLIGMRLSELVVTTEVEKTLQAIQRIINEGHSGRFECSIVKADGTRSVIQWSVQWSPMESSLFCVAQDITERIEIEKMKRDFVAMVSHDLRTPLTAIQMYLEILEQGAYGQINERGLDGLQQASANSEQLVRLVSDLLDLEKIESGILSLEIKQHSLEDLIQTAINACYGIAKKRQISLDLLDFPSTSVHADADRIVQVLTNLLTNAIKFSPVGESVLI